MSSYDFFHGHDDERASVGRSRYSYNRRDSYGNLPGGEMNHTMQSRVIGPCIEDIEARRQQASMQAAAHAAFPRSMEINDVELPVYKYSELEDLGKQKLRMRCLDYRDRIEATGCRFFENHLHLKLNAAQGEDKMLQWFINVQVTLAAALGMEELDHAAFGAAHLESTLPPPAPHNQQQERQEQQRQQRQPPPQQQQRMTPDQYEQMMMMREQQQMQQQQMPQQMSDEEHEHLMMMRRHQQMQQQQQIQMHQQQENRSEQNRPPPSRGQKAPPSRGMHDSSDGRASRFDDAARIRAKNDGGSNIFG